MNRIIIIIIGCLYLLSACSTPSRSNKNPAMNASELTTINQTIEKVFAAISFEKGQPPNMPQLEDLFIKEGLLINYNEEKPLILPVKAFIQHFDNQFQQGLITELEDKEVYHQTHIYDRIAHRFSFYEARFKSTDERPFAVGVNSMQLVKIEGQWLVSSMAWNDDKRGAGFFEKVMGKEGL